MSIKLDHILVVGAGTMGSGIAQWFTQQNVKVELLDLDYEFAKKALKKIHDSWDKLSKKEKFTSDEIKQFKGNIKVVNKDQVNTNCDLLIEAIIEKKEIKQKFFSEMDSLLKQECLFASNTSSFPITSLCEHLPEKRKTNFIGLHFFNPAPIMKLVEVIKGTWTPKNLLNDFAEWFSDKGKKPAICGESPGFIVNRVARNYYGEAFRIANSDLPDKYHEIDKVMKTVGGFRMGPYELMDLIGIDINYDVTQSVWNAFDREPRFAPHNLQKEMVESGRLGKKSGRGFYHYE